MPPKKAAPKPSAPPKEKPAAKKKGLSIEEKVAKIHEVLISKGEPYTLKEITTWAPKYGVTWQSVKEVLEILVAEGKVQSDKVGSSVFFWSFPATVAVAVENTVAQLEQRIDLIEASIAESSVRISAENDNRCHKNRGKWLDELGSLNKLEISLRSRLSDAADCDPRLYREAGTAALAASEALESCPDIARVLLELVLERRGGASVLPPSLAYGLCEDDPIETSDVDAVARTVMCFGLSDADFEMG